MAGIESLKSDLEKARQGRHLSEIDKLNEGLREIKESLSRLRKKGIDTKIAELLTMSIQPKINIAKITWEEKDYAKAMEFIEKAKQELAQSEKSELLLKELEKKATEGSLHANIKELMAKCRDLLGHNNIADAQAAYGELQKSFALLPDDAKISLSEEFSSLFRDMTAATRRAASEGNGSGQSVVSKA